mmetsp:Transcript_3656/g.9279  ORF Transcript_3656/g.9279 Transcript_3656/m.9279 type:complete len:397 (+) Transcript_3656:59-1249(+)
MDTGPEHVQAGRPPRTVRSFSREGLTERGRKVASKLREKQELLRKERAKQLAEVGKRVQKVLGKARSAKARQLRHMVCFVLSCADMVVTAFWVGASPLTFYYYYTFKCMALILCRLVWYSLHGDHYYLFDLCYFANGLLLVYLWLFPRSLWVFQAAYGFSGVLQLSVPVFRNSFVPHSLDKMTSLQIHASPALQLWAIRWFADSAGSCHRVSETVALTPSIACYLGWALFYALVTFVIRRHAIERKGYGTLYALMADTYGYRAALPKSLQGPVGSRLVFMAGHFALFCIGLVATYNSFWTHTACLALSVLWSFKNGATFYMGYFWKVYDKQIHAFEQQLAVEEAKVAKADEQDTEEKTDYEQQSKLLAHEAFAGSLEVFSECFSTDVSDDESLVTE